jgi:hypothetical protein
MKNAYGKSPNSEIFYFRIYFRNSDIINFIVSEMVAENNRKGVRTIVSH